MVDLSNCLLCESNNFVCVYETTKYPDKIQLCQKCGLVFRSPRMDDQELKEFYLSDHFSLINRKRAKPDDKIISRAIKIAETRFGHLKNYINSSDDILEIGSGAGQFLQILKNKNISYQGIDLSSGFVKSCQAMGLNVNLGSFPEDISFHQYSKIAIFQTIEHLPDPKKCIQNCYDFLKSDGLLFLEYPDLSRYLKYRENPSTNVFSNRGHLSDFTEYTMRNLLLMCGFEWIRSFSNLEDRPESDKNILIVAKKLPNIIAPDFKEIVPIKYNKIFKKLKYVN